jgi:hypothetical protein
MHGLWALIGGGRLGVKFHESLLIHDDPVYRSWGIRAAGNQRTIESALRLLVEKAADDPSPDVKLQVAIAARKIEGIDSLAVLLRVLATCGDDKQIPCIVWQNLHPVLDQNSDRFLALVKEYDLKTTKNLAKIMPRVTEKLLSKRKP